MLHLSAADIVNHFQNEVTVESVTSCSFIQTFMYSRGELQCTVLNYRTVLLLLTILTVSVDGDVLEVFRFYCKWLSNCVCAVSRHEFSQLIIITCPAEPNFPPFVWARQLVQSTGY